jgi:hypothetical protein
VTMTDNAYAKHKEREYTGRGRVTIRKEERR